uniref:ShKT domain-containing protein n=1 Tax=Globodera rostochiensis TaxID=31243 RepID=A0A914HSN4_GLORO
MILSITLLKLIATLIIYGSAGGHNRHVVDAQETATLSPCGRTPNYTICSTRAPNLQQACLMGLQSKAASDKAVCDCRIVTWDQLPPVSAAITLPTFRQPTKKEQDAQPPPSQIRSDLYSSLDIKSICEAVRGIYLGDQQCYYDPNNTASTTLASSIGVRERRQAGTPNATLFKCTRKEYRMLSTDERTRYHNALLQLKQGHGSYEYNRIAALHSDPAQMPGGHGGPTFVCWHREYLKRLEIALRAVDPSVCLPFWDSTLDWRLPSPSDSILWSDLLMGSPDENGYVTNGFLTNWLTADGDPIRRYLGDGALFPLNAADNILSSDQMYNIFAFADYGVENCNIQDYNNVLEDNHNNVHVFVSGDMAYLETAPQDPIFFMHHCFIDYIWEQWRLRWQNRTERETQFPPYSQIDSCTYGNTYYQLNETMVPFLDPALQNSVCLSNNYTDFLYTYSLSPTCEKAGGCGSPFLFCDTTNQTYPFHPTCCSKIKPDGDCSIFVRNSEQPCFNSTCNESTGKCQQFQQLNMLKKVELDANRNCHGNSSDTTPSPTPAPSKSRVCYDHHECCAQWVANGTCDAAKQSMSVWCPGSCHYDGCQPHPKAGGTPAAGGCMDVLDQCERWAKVVQHPGHGHGLGRAVPPIPMTECARNVHFMARNCAKSCNKCGVTTNALQCASLTPKDYKSSINQ